MELTTADSAMRVSCVCGQDYTYPDVVNTGTRPSERAAERSRSKAFRAAGLVKNVGGFALGISLLGILFFPIALIGAAIGIYVLTMMRGPTGRYSGRRQAALAVGLGVVVFIVEGSVAMSWMASRRAQRIQALQSSAAEDLRALLRAERLYRAMNDTYGSFQEFRFASRFGIYTLYLGPDDFIPAHRSSGDVVDPLPPGFMPGVSEDAFTAVAVANLDSDPALDVWVLDERGELAHRFDDASEVVGPAERPVADPAPLGSSPVADPAPRGPSPSADPAPRGAPPVADGPPPVDPAPLGSPPSADPETAEPTLAPAAPSRSTPVPAAAPQGALGPARAAAVVEDAGPTVASGDPAAKEFADSDEAPAPPVVDAAVDTEVGETP